MRAGADIRGSVYPDLCLLVGQRGESNLSTKHGSVNAAAAGAGEMRTSRTVESLWLQQARDDGCSRAQLEQRNVCSSSLAHYRSPHQPALLSLLLLLLIPLANRLHLLFAEPLSRSVSLLWSTACSAFEASLAPCSLLFLCDGQPRRTDQ